MQKCETIHFNQKILYSAEYSVFGEIHGGY